MGVSYLPLLLLKKYSLFRVPVWEPGITSDYGMVQQGSCAFGQLPALMLVCSISCGSLLVERNP